MNCPNAEVVRTRARIVVATTLATAGLSLAACSSSSPAPAARATPPAQHASAAPRDSTIASQQSTASAGSGAGSGASASSINGCALVTRQDASTAIGGDAGAGSGGTLVCSYLGQAGSVTIFVTPLSGPGDFDGSRSVGEGSAGYQDVPGVGDAAFLNVQPGSIKLNFRKGLVMVAIVCTAKTTGSVITLARTAASRF